jgi:hypothetical protein
MDENLILFEKMNLDLLQKGNVLKPFHIKYIQDFIYLLENYKLGYVEFIKPIYKGAPFNVFAKFPDSSIFLEIPKSNNLI